jgi:hypothetical protein
MDEIVLENGEGGRWKVGGGKWQVAGERLTLAAVEFDEGFRC